jgi:hypothetical protein
VSIFKREHVAEIAQKWSFQDQYGFPDFSRVKRCLSEAWLALAEFV